MLRYRRRVSSVSLLATPEVQEVRIGSYAFRIVCEIGDRAEPDVYVDVTEFVYLDTDGKSYELDAESGRKALGRALFVVCAPGGEVAVWTES